MPYKILQLIVIFYRQNLYCNCNKFCFALSFESTFIKISEYLIALFIISFYITLLFLLLIVEDIDKKTQQLKKRKKSSDKKSPFTPTAC